MKAVIGLSLLLIAGVLIWQAISGHAVDIISAIRAQNTTSTGTTPNNNGGIGTSGNKGSA